MELTHSIKMAVLGGILYYKSVRELYTTVMRNASMSTLLGDPQIQTAYAGIERIMRLYITADIDVRPEVIMKRLVEQWKLLPPVNVVYNKQYQEILVSLDAKDEFSEQLSQRFIQDINTERIVLTAKEELSKLRPVREIQAVMDDLSHQLSATNKPGKVRLYNPVADAKKLLVHRDKVPTGVAWFDVLTGGGITWGEHGGCLGPSGGGKSVIANVLTCNIAIQGYNAMLLQFEQSLKDNSDIISRIYSYLTRLPTSEFRNKNYDEMSDEAREALDRCAKVSDRIRCGAFIDDDVDRSVDTIIETIEDSCNDGFVPKFVVIDWLGAVVSEFMAAATGNDKQYPLMAQEVQDKLNAYGKSKGISLFYLHQSSIDASEKESGYKPRKTDSYYFRGFAQKLEYCLQLGTKSPLDDGRYVAWLVAGKVRDAESDKARVVIVDGLHAKMELSKDGEYKVNAKGQIVPVNQMLDVAKDDEDDTFPVSGADAFIGNF